MAALKLRQSYAGTGAFANVNTVTVTHNIGIIPTIIMLTWQSSPGTFGMNLYISAKTTTTFTANTSSMATGTFGWLAII